MKQWVIKLHRFIIDKKEKRIGIIVIAVLLLLCIIGEFETFYIKKMGVYTLGEITEVNHTPRGGISASFKYSYKGKLYQKRSTFPSGNINYNSVGKKIIIVLLPKHPSMCAVVGYPKNCIKDVPPEGWKEIPKCE